MRDNANLFDLNEEIFYKKLLSSNDTVIATELSSKVFHLYLLCSCLNRK